MAGLLQKLPPELLNNVLRNVFDLNGPGTLEIDERHYPRHPLGLLRSCKSLEKACVQLLNEEVIWVQVIVNTAQIAQHYERDGNVVWEHVELLDSDLNGALVEGRKPKSALRYHGLRPQLALQLFAGDPSASGRYSLAGASEHHGRRSKGKGTVPSGGSHTDHHEFTFAYTRLGYNNCLLRIIEACAGKSMTIRLRDCGNSRFGKLAEPFHMTGGLLQVALSTFNNYDRHPERLEGIRRNLIRRRSWNDWKSLVDQLIDEGFMALEEGDLFNAATIYGLALSVAEVLLRFPIRTTDSVFGASTELSNDPGDIPSRLVELFLTRVEKTHQADIVDERCATYNVSLSSVHTAYEITKIHFKHHASPLPARVLYYQSQCFEIRADLIRREAPSSPLVLHSYHRAAELIAECIRGSDAQEFHDKASKAKERLYAKCVEASRRRGVDRTDESLLWESDPCSSSSSEASVESDGEMYAEFPRAIAHPATAMSRRRAVRRRYQRKRLFKGVS